MGKMQYGTHFLFCCPTPDCYLSWGVLDTQWFNCYLACFYALIEHKKGGKFVSHFIEDFSVMYQELEQNTPTVTYVFYHALSAWMDICHICVICCAVQLFSLNVALIIYYQYHIKIEKRSEIKAHLYNTMIVMS